MYDPSAPREGDDGAYEPLEVFYGDDAAEAQLLRPTGGRVGPNRPPPPHTGTGRALLTGIAMGLREVFDPEPKDRMAIEQEAPGQPTEPQRLEVHLDPFDPCQSFAVYRPWLADGGRPPA
ncbi:MAG: hypothetical protein M3O23_04650 [Actinomycetota bacterium]|nr:hypothetical protein [Actinomycetota bacterium]